MKQQYKFFVRKLHLLLFCFFAEKRSVRKRGMSCGRDCQSLKLITK